MILLVYESTITIYYCKGGRFRLHAFPCGFRKYWRTPMASLGVRISYHEEFVEPELATTRKFNEGVAEEFSGRARRIITQMS